jgi:hypothetical protein
MNSDAIKAWLKRKKSAGAISRILLAFVALIGGLVVLFLTFWFTYAIIWFGFHGVSAFSSLVFSQRLHLTHEWRLLGSSVFMALLFLQHFRTHPSHWGDYPKQDYVAAPALQFHAGILGALGFMLAYPGASANMIADILLSGPRLLTGAWTLIRESNRLRQLDVEGCSQLLAFLAGRPLPVPYEELREAGWEPWFSQLRSIEGIVFLGKGLNLTAELRKELIGLKQG